MTTVLRSIVPCYGPTIDYWHCPASHHSVMCESSLITSKLLYLGVCKKPITHACYTSELYGRVYICGRIVHSHHSGKRAVELLLQLAEHQSENSAGLFSPRFLYLPLPQHTTHPCADTHTHTPVRPESTHVIKLIPQLSFCPRHPRCRMLVQT